MFCGDPHLYLLFVLFRRNSHSTIPFDSDDERYVLQHWRREKGRNTPG